MKLLINNYYMENYSYDEEKIAPYIELINKYMDEKRDGFLSSLPIAIFNGEPVDSFLSRELRFKIQKIMDLDDDLINDDIVKRIMDEPFE